MIEIVVCDDNIEDLNHATDLLNNIFENKSILFNIRVYLSAGEMLDAVQKIDIGILDIAMKEYNGIEVGRKIREKFPNVKLIYITSFEEYCMRAINEAHAFSFLCKPLDRYKLQVQIKELLDNFSEPVVEKEFYKVTDSQKKEYPSMKFNLKDILYFEYIKRQRRASIVLTDKIYECECVFERLAEELKPYDFVVNCRGNLVNLMHVQRIKGHIVYLDNGKELVIAQKRVVEFRTQMNEFLQRNS